MTISELVGSLGDNPYFGAGFGLVGVGAVLGICRKGLQHGIILFQRYYLTSLEVPCRDQSYSWLLQWITLNSRHSNHLSVQTLHKTSETGKVTTSFDFIPSPGVHVFTYRGRWIRVERNREQSTLDLQMGVPFETVKLTTLGRQKKLFAEILDEARNMALAKHEGKTIMYMARTSSWEPFGNPRSRRPLRSVILDQGVKESICNDIIDFLDSHKWYADRGVPYRRGYLLYGPPGSGKTSFITALAGELEYGICTLNLSDRGLSDDRLHYLMNVVPENCLVLLEDVDAAFVSREESAKTQAAYEGLNRLTFSGLLNVLDGVASAESRIIFMTTNYIERLDPALIRPGRVDRKFYIGHATDHQLKQAFLSFYPESDSALAETFVSRIRKQFTEDISMAAIQGHFLMYKDEPHQAIENVFRLEKQKVKLKSQ